MKRSDWLQPTAQRVLLSRPYDSYNIIKIRYTVSLPKTDRSALHLTQGDPMFLLVELHARDGCIPCMRLRVCPPNAAGPVSPRVTVEPRPGASVRRRGTAAPMRPSIGEEVASEEPARCEPVVSTSSSRSRSLTSLPGASGPWIPGRVLLAFSFQCVIGRNGGEYLAVRRKR